MALQPPREIRTDETCPAEQDYRRLIAIDQRGPRLRRGGEGHTFEAEGLAVQVSALLAALGYALLLTWPERIFADVQEAVIGVVFLLGATGSVLLLATYVHGGEHLRDLLVGQILWMQPARLAWIALVYAATLALWFGPGTRLPRASFYVLFAIAVTLSVQLVGRYLVLATLIVPPLATRRMTRRRLAAAWALGVAGYAVADLPSGWVKATTTPSAKQFEPGRTGAGLFGYGYQTWLIGGKGRQFVLRGLRGQAIFVDPASKLVLVHTSAGPVGGMSPDLLALWFSVSKHFAE